MSDLANRYQNQPWYVKLWRRRWYLTIPHTAVRLWRSERKRDLRDDLDWRMTFSQCWGLAKGLAQGPMLWWHTWDEVKERIAAKGGEE